MKKAKEYFGNKGGWFKTDTYEYDDVIELMQLIQKDAIEDTLIYAAKKAYTMSEPMGSMRSQVVDENSILNLKNELFKELK
jgi:hypothetical protein